MEEHQYEELHVNSARHFNDEIQKVPEESSLSCTEEARISCCPQAETSISTDMRTEFRGNDTVEGSSGNVATSTQRNCLSEHKDLVSPDQVCAGHSRPESYSDGNNTASSSTSFVEQRSSDPVSVNDFTNMDRINNVDDPVFSGVSRISHHETVQPRSSISREHGNASSGEISVEVDTNAGISIHSSSTHVAQASNAPPTPQMPEDESRREAIPSGLGIFVSNREIVQGNDGMFQVDVVAISSNILSGSNTDADDQDARRNGRRLFWDAFSQRSSRRFGDSPTIVISTGGADDSGSQDRWQVDFDEDLSNDGVGRPPRYRGSRIRRLSERVRHSRSEVILNILYNTSNYLNHILAFINWVCDPCNVTYVTSIS